MYEYRQLTVKDKDFCLPGILNLVDREKQHAKFLLETRSPDFYEKFFSCDGVVWGVFKDAKMVGFALLGYSNLVSEFWQPYIDAFGVKKSTCGALRSVLVQQSDRGQGIGSTLFSLRLLHAKEQGLKYLFGTVHPDNIASLMLFKKYGFVEIEKQFVFQPAVLRILMSKAIDDLFAPQIGENIQKECFV